MSTDEVDTNLSRVGRNPCSFCYGGDYSICIIGKREPSFEEAHNFFDMEQEEQFPVFE